MFAHPALFYDGPEDYLTGTVGFIRAGLAVDEPVMAAVPPENLALIRDRLGPDAARVRLYDMTVAGRNPGRIIPGVLLAFAAAHPDRRVRIVGEPLWPGRTELEYPACAQHEALINAAFAGRRATILCPYDIAGLAPRVVADARRTHPFLVDSFGEWRSDDYADPFAVAGEFNVPLPAMPEHAVTVGVVPGSLSSIRRHASDLAHAAGLTGDRVADLTIAVNELATNTIVHGGGAGVLASWVDDGVLVCQVSDAGHLADPLAGRIPPAADMPGGRGLVLVNQLCDLVRVHTGPAGTTIRIIMSRK